MIGGIQKETGEISKWAVRVAVTSQSQVRRSEGLKLEPAYSICYANSRGGMFVRYIVQRLIVLSDNYRWPLAVGWCNCPLVSGS